MLSECVLKLKSDGSAVVGPPAEDFMAIEAAVSGSSSEDEPPIFAVAVGVNGPPLIDVRSVGDEASNCGGGDEGEDFAVVRCCCCLFAAAAAAAAAEDSKLSMKWCPLLSGDESHRLPVGSLWDSNR